MKAFFTSLSSNNLLMCKPTLFCSTLFGYCCDLKKCLENDLYWDCLWTEIFLRDLTNAFEHAEFKPKNVPLRRPAVFSLTVSKCIIQRCKTVIVFNGSDLNFQHSFWDVIQEVTLVFYSTCALKEYYCKEGSHIRWYHQINSSCPTSSCV